MYKSQKRLLTMSISYNKISSEQEFHLSFLDILMTVATLNENIFIRDT